MKNIVKKLSLKYFEHTGESPEFGFWSWLAAMGVAENEKSLENLYNDPEIWNDLKSEYEERDK